MTPLTKQSAKRCCNYFCCKKKKEPATEAEEEIKDVSKVRVIQPFFGEKRQLKELVMIVPEDWKPTSPIRKKKEEYYLKDKVIQKNEYVEGYRIS